jgi:flagellar biosynthesis protein FliQ
VPKLIVMVLALTFTLPWLVTRLVEYTQQVFTTIPDGL